MHLLLIPLVRNLFSFVFWGFNLKNFHALKANLYIFNAFESRPQCHRDDDTWNLFSFVIFSRLDSIPTLSWQYWALTLSGTARVKGPLSRGTPYNFFLGIGCLQGTQETLDLPLVDRWPYWPFSSKAPLKIFSNPIKTFRIKQGINKRSEFSLYLGTFRAQTGTIVHSRNFLVL